MKKRKRRRTRQQGTGSIYQQPGTVCYTIQYYNNGRRIRESTGLHSRQAAQDLLNQKLAAVSKGELVGLVKPATVQQLYDYLCEYNKANRKNTETARWMLHLKDAFANVRANRITSQMIIGYRNNRTAQRASTATVNRELAMLRHMLRLGYQASPPLVTHVPHIPLASEAHNVRKGFIETADYLKLSQAAEFTGELWLQTFIELAYSYGWRRGELLSLQCGQVNLADRTVRLEVGDTKNDEGREVVMTQRVYELLTACCKGKKPADYVLTRGKPARRVADVRCAWRNLCVTVGLGRWACTTPKCDVVQAKQGRCPNCKARKWEYRGLLVHDLRRSAAKAMRRAGIAEAVAMKVTGHKTSSMFRRYAIVSHTEQSSAAKAIEQARQAELVALAKLSDHKAAIAAPPASQKLQ